MGEEFLERIRMLLRQKDLSVSEFEEKLGISTGMTSKWSRMVPGADKLIAMAEVLEVSVDTLLGLDKPGEPKKKAERRLEEPVVAETEDLLATLLVDTNRSKIKWISLETPLTEQTLPLEDKYLFGECCVFNDPDETDGRTAYIMALARNTGEFSLFGVPDLDSATSKPVKVDVAAKELQRNMERLAVKIKSSLLGPLNQIKMKRRIDRTISGEYRGVA